MRTLLAIAALTAAISMSSFAAGIGYCRTHFDFERVAYFSLPADSVQITNRSGETAFIILSRKYSADSIVVPPGFQEIFDWRARGVYRPVVPKEF